MIAKNDCSKGLGDDGQQNPAQQEHRQQNHREVPGRSTVFAIQNGTKSTANRSLNGSSDRLRRRRAQPWRADRHDGRHD